MRSIGRRLEGEFRLLEEIGTRLTGMYVESRCKYERSKDF